MTHNKDIYYLICNHKLDGYSSVYAVRGEYARNRAERHLTEALGPVRVVDSQEAAEALRRLPAGFGAACYLDSGSGSFFSELDKIVSSNQLYLNLMRAINCNPNLSPVKLEIIKPTNRIS